MDYNAFEILGLPSTATRDEVKDKYNELRKQYLEDRFKTGDEGERAAEKLQELDVAYRDAMDAIDEREQRANRAANADNATSDNGATDDYESIRQQIKDNKLDEALGRIGPNHRPHRRVALFAVHFVLQAQLVFGVEKAVGDGLPNGA